MWQNYLDYSDDACMNVFTNDQKNKMLNFISNTTNYKNLTSTANVDAVSCPTTTTNFTVSTSSNPVAGGTTTGGGTYASGSNVTVTATTNNGYTFTKWTENGSQVSTNASYTFAVSANRNLVANFTQKSSGIDEAEEQNLSAVSIYPNPVSSELTVKIDEENITEIKVFNVLGEQVFKSKDVFTHEYKLNTSAFLKGIYFIEVRLSNEQIVTKKIMKQ
jgi:uncharacterized repeat protein (TIGR02543 family)